MGILSRRDFLTHPTHRSPLIKYRYAMSTPQENGTEGDDEREEGDEDTEEDKDDDEEEEDERRLKYQRMGGTVPSLLFTDAASSVAVAERIIVVGTHGGSVHRLDFLRNQVFSARGPIGLEFKYIQGG